MRRSLSSVLRRLGYRVLQASGLREAEHLAHAGAVHVLFLDLCAPEAAELEQALWLCVRFPDIKTVVASDSFWELDNRIGSAGNFTFLAKPFTAEDLAWMMTEVLK